MLRRTFEFLKSDIWRIRLHDLPKAKSFALKQLRVILLAFKGFDEDKVYLRASALTFYSLLSIVPVAAMAFGIAKGFGFQKIFQKQLLERFPAQEEVISRVIDFAQALLESTKGGVMAGVGIVILFWTVIRVLGNIESSFNDIWGITESRTMVRKFSDYLSLMLVCPVLLILSSSTTVYISTQISALTDRIALLGFFSPIISLLLKILPYTIVWGLFCFIYILIPNTKVNFRSGLLGGLVAGSIYEIAQWGYIVSQVGVTRYNAIYGSFAALPLFLIWLQISWFIVLFGAEIAFAHQNVDTYEFEPESLDISYSFRALLSLEISHLLVKNFSTGETPHTASEISHRLEIPIRLVRNIIYELIRAGIISEVHVEGETERAYQPAFDINRLTIGHVLTKLADKGKDDLPVARTEELNELSQALQHFKEAVEKSSSNRLLKEI